MKAGKFLLVLLLILIVGCAVGYGTTFILVQIVLFISDVMMATHSLFW